MEKADVIIIGAGLSGLVAACELIAAGRRVILLDQEGDQSLGGQAYWSLGGFFLINSPEQRRLGIHDSLDLARQDWMSTAGFDREEDHWPRQWAEAYLQFAAGEKRSWLRRQGIRFFPVVGWAERGGSASGPGNSVPRFHISWGTGPAVVAPFVEKIRAGIRQGLLTFYSRHQVQELLFTNGQVSGVHGSVLEPDERKRGLPSSRWVVAAFSFHADKVLITSGGIGGNQELVRQNWPERLGKPPEHMLCGVPDYVDGRMIGIAAGAGARLINADRMWHYTEGITNWDPLWTAHGIRILPGPSSLWLDATGKRLPPPLFPGFDTLSTLDYIRKTGYDYTWFVLNQKIIRKEFALSGSEQNPDLSSGSWWQVLHRALGQKAPTPVEAFKEHGIDFIVRNTLESLVEGMNTLTGDNLISFDQLHEELRARDRELENPFNKDLQLTAIQGARRYIGDRLIRTASPHQLLDPAAGPLIAVRLHLLTRKTLGGLETDLEGRVLQAGGEPLPGLYAAGEASGFGGGGMHGYRALEGTFLGGCIFSGLAAGRSIVRGGA